MIRIVTRTTATSARPERWPSALISLHPDGRSAPISAQSVRRDRFST
jgi:hypothetical protein